MPDTYYKLAVKGVASGQNVVNILYYGDSGGDPFTSYDEGRALDLADAWGEVVIADWLTALPESYTLVELEVTGVNPNGVTTSPYAVIDPVNSPGLEGSVTSGAMICAIVAFQTSLGFSASINVKRSYIAFGPVTEAFVNADQSLTGAFATLMAPILISLASPIGGSLDDYVPVRIGRTVSPNPIHVGKVNGITLRPYASTRKSRKRTPRGT